MKNGDYILSIAPDNYPGKKYRGKYCYQHHLSWWSITDEVIEGDEVIHHIDGNKYNNHISNLEKLTNSEHTALHHKEHPPETIDLICYECNKPFTLELRTYKSRIKNYGNYDLCCSRSCQVKKQRKDKNRL